MVCEHDYESIAWRAPKEMQGLVRREDMTMERDHEFSIASDVSKYNILSLR